MIDENWKPEIQRSPIPPHLMPQLRHTRLYIPFDDMAVGDWFDIPVDPVQGRNDTMKGPNLKLLQKFQNFVRRRNRQRPDTYFSVKKYGDGRFRIVRELPRHKRGRL